MMDGGMMGGMLIWTIIGVLLIILLVVGHCEIAAKVIGFSCD